MKKNKKKNRPGSEEPRHIISREKEFMSNFWIKFIIQEALSVVEVFLQSSKLTPQQKQAAEKLIVDAQAFLATL